MLNNKAKRIIENIYDVILETSFYKIAKKELQKDIEGKNIMVEKNEGKITIQNNAGTRNLYTITINWG